MKGLAFKLIAAAVIAIPAALFSQTEPILHPSIIGGAAGFGGGTNYFFISNGTVGVWVSPATALAAIGGTGGTGSANTVALWSGASTLTYNSGITWTSGGNLTMVSANVTGLSTAGYVTNTSGGLLGTVTAAAAAAALNYWTLSGSNVYRDAGNVGIQTASPSAPLTVGVDLGQTTAKVSIFHNFYSNLGGDAFGIYANVYTPAAQSGTVYGYYLNAAVDHSSGNANLIGAYYQTNSNNSGNSGQLISQQNLVNSGGTGTISLMSGYRCQLQSTHGAIITDAIGIHNASPTYFGGTVITNHYGLKLDSPNLSGSGGATISNNYGIYIEDQSYGTNRYSLYSNGGNSYFKDNVGIGVASTAANLDVNGSIRFRSFTTTGNIFSVSNSSGDLTTVTPASIITSGGGVTGTGSSGRVALWSSSTALTSDAALTFSSGILQSQYFDATEGYRIDNATQLFAPNSANTFVGGGGNASVSGAHNFTANNEAGAALTSGQGNFFAGYRAGKANTTGSGNEYIGSQAGEKNVDGNASTVIGLGAGGNSTQITSSILLGQNSFQTITAQIDHQIGIGVNSGYYQTGGAFNLFCGTFAGVNAAKNGALLPTVSNVAWFGQDSAPFNKVAFGKGITAESPTSYELSGTDAFSGNVAGGGLVLSGGLGSGSGSGGKLTLRAAATTSYTTTGTTYLHETGNWSFGNNVASNARIWVEGTNGTNQGIWVAGLTGGETGILETGTATGSGVITPLKYSGSAGGDAQLYLQNSSTTGGAIVNLEVNASSTGDPRVQFVGSNSFTVGLDMTDGKLHIQPGTLTTSGAGLFLNSVGDLEMKSVAYFLPPLGTTAQRPSSPTEGMTRHNTTIHSPEYYDGSTWQPIGGAGISGTGSANRLALWNGTSSQTSDANLTWGSGTITAGTSLTSALHSSSADGSASAPVFSWASDANTGIYRVGADILGFSTGGTERARLDASGNMGVNTSGPDRRLDILDASNPQLRLTQADGSFYTDFKTDGSGNISILPNGGRTILGTFSAASRVVLGLDIGADARLCSFYGVGSDYGSDLVGVYLNHYANAAQSGTLFGIQNYTGLGNADGSTSTVGAYYQSYKNGAGAANQVISQQNLTGNSGTGAITLLTGYRCQIQSTGSAVITDAIGIHNSNPTFSAGTVTNHYGLKLDSPNISGGGTIVNNYGIYVDDQAYGTNRYAIYSNGGNSYFKDNVGINTTSPSEKLHVSGNIRLTGAFYDASNSAGTTGYLLKSTGTGTAWASVASLGLLTIYTGDGSFTGNRVVTLGSYSLKLDASAASSTPNTMLILKGKETSFNTRFIDYTNESGTTSFRASSNASLVTLAALNSHELRVEGATEVNVTTGSDIGLKVKSDGTVNLYGSLSADPGSPLEAGLWYRNDLDLLKTKVGSTVTSIATESHDFVGDIIVLSSASTITPGGTSYFYRLDANSNAITVTLNTTLLEGREYLIRCYRNGTNTITFSAGGGCVFYVDTKSSATLSSLVTGASGTGIEAPDRILTVRRLDTVIYIK